MSPGPLRRITAAIGLLAMAPIAMMMFTSALTPQEAAMRAVVLVLAVLLVGNLVRVIITQLLNRVERELPDVVEDAGASGIGPSGTGGGGQAPGAAGRSGGLSAPNTAVGGTGRTAPTAGGQGGDTGGEALRRRTDDREGAGRR